MKTLVSRWSLLGAFVLIGCASLPAQDPYPVNSVRYSEEELDNLVAPVALYPDALLAQILVASTFPDQIEQAHRHVRERGTRDIENQGWDIAVKAVAYYPPVLNMLATQEDWSLALGQAYASQSGDVMDAVQRLRELAREQGNLVSTREHTVTEDRGRIVIVPANPQVIYVPTYDPAIIYVRPIWSFGFHTGYFSFGIGFPIGSWLVYEPDWWGHYGHRVYYHGWYGDGWRYHARRHFVVYPVYHRPRYSIVNINVNIFSRRVNYITLDRRHRYVRRSVEYERHYRSDRDRYADRDRWERDNDDRRGPYAGPDGNGRSRDDSRGPVIDRGNDRIGDRIARFDDYRPDRGGTGSDARDAEPPVSRSGFGGERDGTTRSGSGAEVRSRTNVPVFTSQPRAGEKTRENGRSQTEFPEFRGSRPDVPVFTSQPRTTERKSKGTSGESPSEFRGSRPDAPVFSAPERSVERKSNGTSRSQEYRSAPRSNGGAVFSAPQRSVERKSSGGTGSGGQFDRSTIRSSTSAPRAQSSTGGQFNRSTMRSAPTAPRAQSSGGGGGGGGGKVKSSGGSGSSGGGAGVIRGGSGKGSKQ